MRSHKQRQSKFPPTDAKVLPRKTGLSLLYASYPFPPDAAPGARYRFKQDLFQEFWPQLPGGEMNFKMSELDAIFARMAVQAEHNKLLIVELLPDN